MASLIPNCDYIENTPGLLVGGAPPVPCPVPATHSFRPMLKDWPPTRVNYCKKHFMEIKGIRE